MILSIDTSTYVCSVAVHDEGKLLTDLQLNQERAHANALSPMIAQAFKLLKINASDLDAIAVSAGPGSYTGLRIGASTAKGLAYSLGIPLIEVSTLEAMAWQVIRLLPSSAFSEFLFFPMIDARRMEVFTAGYDQKMQEVFSARALVVEAQSLHTAAAKQVFIFGDGAAKCRQVLTDLNHTYIPDVWPHASAIGALAWEKFLQQNFTDLIKFEPKYLKEFMAGIPTKNKPLA